MADVSIDSIQLQIESDSSDAEKSVERLATSLMGLNRSLLKAGSNAGAVRNLAKSLAALADIKNPDLSGIISQLRSLSEIKAEKLSKNVKLNVDDSGVDKLDRIKDKLQEAFNGMKDLKLNQTGISGVLNSISKIADVDLSKFDQNSFSGIIDGLKKFSNLKDADLKGTGVSSFTNTLTKLTKLDTSKASVELGNLRNSLNGFKGIDIKSTGIASMINASVKLSEADFSNFDPKIFKTMAMSIKSLSVIGGKTADSVKVVTQFASAFSRLLNATQDMTDVDARLGQFANTLQSFFSSISNIPEVNDNILRMTEALAQLSKGADKARDSLTKYRSSGKAVALSTALVNSAFESVGTTFNILAKTLKKFTNFAYVKPFQSLLNVAKDLGSKGVDGIKKFIGKVKELNNAGVSFKSFAGKLKEVLGLLVGIRGITGVFNWVKDATEAGANVAETNHIIEQTFGDLSEQVNNWAKDAIENYGIAQTSAKRYAGTLSAMFQSSGIGYKKAAEMSMDLVGMAGDLSSFYNVDTATVFAKLKSGMAGMVRPLRDFGIDLSVASLNEFALAQNMGKTYAQMTQAEKTMLRYQYLLQATSNQQGDFQKTNTSMANSLRTLKAYLEAITETLGEGFVSALRHVVRWLNSVAKRVLSVAQVFRDFMEVLFGKNISGGITINDYEEMDDFATDTADATGATSDNLGDAADNAKELKKELSVLPFDELNQLAKPKEESETKSPSGSSGGIGDSGLGGVGQGLLDQMSEAFDGNGLPDAVNRWAERIKKAFLDKDWKGLGEALADGINEGIQKLYDILDPDKLHKKIDPWIDAFVTTFNSLIDKLHFNQLGAAMARGLNFLLESANRILTKTDWKRLGEQFGEWANGLIHNIEWDELGQFFANKLNAFWSIADGFVNTFDWWGLGSGFAEGADNFVKQIDFDTIIDTLVVGLKGISGTVKTFALEFPWKENGELLASKVNDFIDRMPTAELGDAIGTLTQGFVDGFNAIFDPETGVNFERLGIRLAIGIYSIVYHVKPEEVGKLLGNIFNSAWDLLKGSIEGLPAGYLGTSVGTAIGDAIRTVDGGDIGETLKLAWNKGWKFLKNAVSQLGSKEDGTGTGLGEILKDALVKIVNGITFDDTVATFSTLAKKIAEDIMTAFGDGSIWSELGTKIGEGISNLLTDKELADKAAGAINAITNALKNLITSAIAALIKHKDEIIANFISFFAKLDWGALSLIVGLILAGKLAKVVGALTFAGLKKALIDKIAGIFTKVGVSETVKSAAGGIFTGIKTALGGVATKAATVTLKIKGLFSGLKTSIGNIATTIGESGFFDGFISSIGDAVTPGTLIFAAVAAGAEIQKLGELISGGNGVLTEKGGAIDSFLEKMQELYYTAGDTRQTIFDLKEEWETGGMTDSDFFTQVGETLKNSGINADQAKEAVERLKGQLNLTEDQVKTLDSVVESLGDTSGAAAKQLESIGLDPQDAIQKISDAIHNAAMKLSEMEDTILPGVKTEAQDMFESLAKNGTNIGDALDKVIEYYHLSEDEVKVLAQYIEEELNQPGLFDELIKGASGAKNELVNLNNSPLDKVGESVSGVKTKVSELIGKASEAKTDMNELDNSAKSATESSDAYNESSNKTPGILDLIKTAASNIVGKLLNIFPTSTEASDAIDNGIGQAPGKITEIGTQMEANAKESGKNSVIGVKEGMEEEAQAAYDSMSNIAKGIVDAYNLQHGIASPSTVFKEAAGNDIDGIVLGIQEGTTKVTDAVKKLANDMHYMYITTATNERFKEATQPVIEGIKSALQDGKSQTDQDMKELAESLVSNLKDTLSSEQSEVERSALDFIRNGLINPIKSGIEDADFTSSLSGRLSSMLNAMRDRYWDFYDQGKAIGRAIKEGMESISIPAPHLWVSDWDYHENSDGSWYNTPIWSVGWWAKGGLFRNPSIIGVGEKGDEAVLPLTNDRTMSMIADSILKNSGGGFGLTSSDITSAVVQAMMANQGNQPQINLYAELKTEDNEVLARSVIRGMEQIDYRNNATPKYSY